MLMIEVPEDQDVSEVEIMKFKVFIINFVTGFGVGPSLKSFGPLFSKKANIQLKLDLHVSRTNCGHIVQVMVVDWIRIFCRVWKC